MDVSTDRIRGIFEALQSISSQPLVLREIPIREDGNIPGNVDLISERNFKWQLGEKLKPIVTPDGLKDDEELTRTEMLQSSAEFDASLFESLLEDLEPSSAEIYANITKNFKENRIVTVFLAAEQEVCIHSLQSGI